MDKYTDEELYNYLKNLPEFNNLMFPKSFIDKFNIKQKQFDSIKETIDNQYAIKCQFLPKSGFIDMKTPDDYKFPELKKEDVKLEIKTKLISDPNSRFTLSE